MRFALVVLLVLLPIVTWGKDKINVQDREDAEQDICYACAEFNEAQDLFYRETGGSYRGNPEAGYAREMNLKLKRMQQLQKRYSKRFGKEFDLKLCNGW